MFTTVLIANRGAIACRIMRTLRELGIQSVAVYAHSDMDSLHVRNADQAYCLGEGAASDTYLDMDKIIAIARDSGAQAIHPGYGFLSERAEFVSRCESAGLAFIGPTAEQIAMFGLKHRARKHASAAGVPLLPGSDLLATPEDALAAATAVGYPVMLKTTAGGGGIGMRLCYSANEVASAFNAVRRLGANNFSDDGVFIEKFIERARHIEVQVLGDGKGNALAIGERDCSAQRRNQKVVEECPAPHLTAATRSRLHATAESLLASVAYRNVGTVEFVFDKDSNAFYFLEVNTRLQVEHGVTEAVYGVDLVAYMLQTAAGAPPDLAALGSALTPQGHAVQVRIYAEDPYRNFQPSAGLLTTVDFPEGEGVRTDYWVEAGIHIPPYFDPMLAKLIVHAKDRSAALQKLRAALATTSLYGVATNLDYLRALAVDQTLLHGEMTTRYLDSFQYRPSRIDVVTGGTQTTVQDYPGRTGLWHVGVPPSGPFDSYSFRLANRLLDNPSTAAGLEITMQGPTLTFSSATQIVLGGAAITADLDGVDVAAWSVVSVTAGQTLRLGRLGEQGARSYLCVRGGVQCPEYLGSRATFTLGQFGGHGGRALRAGDVLHLDGNAKPVAAQSAPDSLKPAVANAWALRVICGPHGAPDFFTTQDMNTLFDHAWEVHYNSSRTGVRLIGPKPQWARKDGGEAGLHPSNLHDNAYAFGTVDFTGDMPVILGPDGPSLGGFVCPATVIQADLWKLGQLRAGDTVRFIAISMDDAVTLEHAQLTALKQLKAQTFDAAPAAITSPVLATLDAAEAGVNVVYRAAGDHFLLVEYGEQVLDIALRFRAHVLMEWLQENTRSGIRELTPGIRSLQVHYDSQQLCCRDLLAHLQAGEQMLGPRLDALRVPSRIVHLPLSWDDEACCEAIKRYEQSVRPGAPWCPSNLEFIRRINGLADINAVKQTVFDASYLVLGLGDVYLGAPVATPVDPRHRLVTTKYNPARTWTAENAVGIGGSYLCVYGMEGPGGYQFVGRTLQMWNRYRRTAEFENPWLLRFFDQIRFYEVSGDTLQKIRRDFPQGRYRLRIEQTSFSLSEHQAFLASASASISAFTRQRQQAFDTELDNWHASGQFHFEPSEQTTSSNQADWPQDVTVVDSPVSGSVWQTEVAVGQAVKAGECLLIVESMKMEIPVHASTDGTVTHVLLESGQRVDAGQALVVMKEPA